MSKRGLHSLAKAGRCADITTLLACKADPNVRNADGLAALHLATSHVDVIKTLLDFGARPDTRDVTGSTPLHRAAESGASEVVKLLVTAGASVNLPDGQGRTAAHAAVASGCLECLAVLLSSSKQLPAVGLRDARSETPLMLAAKLQLADQAELLLRTGASDVTAAFDDSEGFTALHTAVAAADFRIIKSIAEYSPSACTATDGLGRAPLHLACDMGNSVIVELLLDLGSAIELRDTTSRSPLHWAVVSGHVDVTEILLKRGVDVNLVDDHGCSPIHYAAQQGETKILKLLLCSGSDKNAVDSAGRSAITWSVIHNRHNTCKILVESGADINLSDAKHFSALHYAAHAGRVQACRYLVTNGANLESADRNGHTPLFRALIEEQTDCVSLLLAAGAREDVKDSELRTGLHWASSAGLPDITTIFLNNAAPVDARDNFGMEPLHEAAAHGHTVICELLLAAGADHCSPDNNGARALHWAALEGHTEVCLLLIQAGATVNPCDDSTPPKTPLDYASAGSHKPCMDTLKAKGALAWNDMDQQSQTDAKLDLAAYGHHVPSSEEQNTWSKDSIPVDKKVVAASSVVMLTTEASLENAVAETVKPTTVEPIASTSPSTKKEFHSGSGIAEHVERMATTRALKSPDKVASKKDRKLQCREKGWHTGRPEHDAREAAKLLERIPQRPEKGNEVEWAPVNHNIAYDRLGGILASNRGERIQLQSDEECLLAAREKEVRLLRSKRSPRKSKQTSRSSGPGSSPISGAILADIKDKCAAFRSTLEIGLNAWDKPPITAKDRTDRHLVKQQVKEALAEVNKLKLETERLKEAVKRTKLPAIPIGQI